MEYQVVVNDPVFAVKQLLEFLEEEFRFKVEKIMSEQSVDGQTDRCTKVITVTS